MYEYITTNTMVVVGTLGMLAFIVNIIVEITKDFFKTIPTKLYTLIISEIVTLGNYVIASQTPLNISALFINFIGGFMICYISMFGWDTFQELYGRFKKGGNDND